MARSPLGRPAPLAPGDEVRVVAPSSPFEADAFAAGIAALRRFGLTVRWRPDLEARDGHLAGSDARRAAEFNEALGDPRVRAIWAVRGGSGALRLLPALGPPPARPGPPPLLIGFSDVTALLRWAERAAGLVAWHGPVVTQLGRLAPAALLGVWRRLQGLDLPAEPLFAGLQVLRGGSARGVLRGGNLSLVSALAGTPWAVPLAGTVLLLEDTGEPLYRLDRLFTQLTLQRGFAGLRGLVLGDFDGLTPAETDWFRGRVLAATEARALPVLCGAPFGHGPRQSPFPLGVSARIDGTAGRVVLAESPWAQRP